MDNGGEKPEKNRYAVERLLGANAHQQGPVSDYIGNRISGALKKFLRKKLQLMHQLKNLKKTLKRSKDSLLENKSEYLISGEFAELLEAIDVLDSIWPLLICVRIRVYMKPVWQNC